MSSPRVVVPRECNGNAFSLMSTTLVSVVTDGSSSRLTNRASKPLSASKHASCLFFDELLVVPLQGAGSNLHEIESSRRRLFVLVLA